MKILIIAPHADDETLVPGGTIAKHAAMGEEVVVALMTGHGPGKHPLWPRSAWERVRTEALKAHAILGVSETIFRELPAVLVQDMAMHEVNKTVLETIEEVKPDVLYLPFLYDLHKDHRVLAYACSVASRPVSKTAKEIVKIYMYETPSETHWNPPYIEHAFQPNAFIDISEFLDIKCQALACYESQTMEFPNCRSIEAVQALAKWRGACAGMNAAEAFILVRELK